MSLTSEVNIEKSELLRIIPRAATAIFDFQDAKSSALQIYDQRTRG
jgi:hypothetical protein